MYPTSLVIGTGGWGDGDVYFRREGVFGRRMGRRLWEADQGGGVRRVGLKGGNVEGREGERSEGKAEEGQARRGDEKGERRKLE
jgi:hypothetical protein